MGKNKVVMRRLRGNEGVRKGVNLADIAYDLADEYEILQPTLDRWDQIDGIRMADKLEQLFTIADLNYLSRSHLGKGVLLGAIMAMCAIEDSIQEQMDDRFPDEEEEPTDEELEEIIRSGVLDFGFGEGGDDDEQQ